MKKLILSLAAIVIASPVYAAELCVTAHSGSDIRPPVGALDKAGAKVCVPVTGTTLNR